MQPKLSTILWLVAGGALALLFVLALFSTWVVEWLWFGELGYRQVFWGMRLAQFTLFVTTFVPLFLYFLLNLRLLAGQLASGEHDLDSPTAEQFRMWATLARLRALTYALAGVGAILFALAVAANWDALIRFRNLVPFGETDPVFARDLGFYIFRLPLIDTVQNTLTTAALLVFVGLLLAYTYFGLFRRWAGWRSILTGRSSCSPGTGSTSTSCSPPT